MKYCLLISMAALAVGVGIAYQQFQLLTAPLPLPDFDPNEFWGSPKQAAEQSDSDNSTPVLMEIRYWDEPIDRLQSHLKKAVPSVQGELSTVGNFEKGFNAEFLPHLVAFWRDDYLVRWRSREVLLNRMPQFKANIQGLDIHYFHTRATYDIRNKTRLPVLLLHGWPGTVRDFYELAALLADPDSAALGDHVFEVVAPSLPGHAWTAAAKRAGRELDVAGTAVLMRNLMRRLGYERFYVYGDGGDGARVAAAVATLFAARGEVIGLHSSDCAVRTPLAEAKELLGGEWQTIVADWADVLVKWWEQDEDGEDDEVTRGQLKLRETVLTPVAMATHIYEQYVRHSHPEYRQLADGGWSNMTEEYRDAILDTITVHHLTHSIRSAMRQLPDGAGLDAVPTPVPTACTRFANGAGSSLASDWQLRDKFTRLVQSTDHRIGGRFAALDRTQAVFEDFAELVRKVQKLGKE